MENTMAKFKVGDIIKFKDGGEEVVAILYENGNKTYGNFRALTVGVQKFRHLNEADLETATPEEFKAFSKQAVKPINPAEVIERETAENGGSLPGQITTKPAWMEDGGDNNDDGEDE